jgi:hypothetical protein
MRLSKIKPAAKELQMHEVTLRRRIRDRGWPVYDLGKKGLLIDVDEILKLTRREPKQPPKPLTATQVLRAELKRRLSPEQVKPTA